ncbi:hypothetical protein K1T71_000574 [Dendrolimus kikuchii]|uniref:Uncharacterized protein n=1 Tax=Dendrolimus kikuchii TaxID=765133 RepID=A0ACC1DJS2_9NEOP|nr:hypothetical protein K1T71_000574 [Dendrolimus kikuchii]
MSQFSQSNGGCDFRVFCTRRTCQNLKQNSAPVGNRTPHRVAVTPDLDAGKATCILLNKFQVQRSRHDLWA